MACIQEIKTGEISKRNAIWGDNIHILDP